MRRTARFTSWLSACLVLATSAVPLARAADATSQVRPNIVLILGDDLAWTDYGFMGHDVVQTPALDRLADSGATFRVGHLNSSLCGPTHFDLLTGIHHSKALSIPTHPTLPREMERAGYRTFHAGKLWSYDENDWGFSEASPHPCQKQLGWRGCGEQRWGRTGWDVSRCGSFAVPGTSCPATAKWRSFLDTTGAEPFFTLFTPALPHHPSDAPHVYRQLYRDAAAPHVARSFFAMVSWFDDLVEEIVQELEQRGLRENTLIVYLADNGIRSDVSGIAQTVRHEHFKGKRSTYEVGMRTPILFSWPAGKVPAGVVREDLVSVADVYATLLDVAGRPLPAGGSGISIRPAITSRSPHPRHEVVTSFFGARIVRTPEWRYIREGTNEEPRLYAIARDPHERENLIGKTSPSLHRSLERSFELWRQSNGLGPTEESPTG